MTQALLLQDVLDGITVAAFCTAVMFVAVYTGIASWWRSSLGITIVALDVAIALVLLPSMLHFVFGLKTAQSTAFGWFEAAVFVCVPVITLCRLYVLWQMRRTSAQPRPRPARRQEHSEEGLLPPGAHPASGRM